MAFLNVDQISIILQIVKNLNNKLDYLENILPIIDKGLNHLKVKELNNVC